MRFSEMLVLFSDVPRLLRRDGAALYLGGELQLKELEKAGWVRPLRKTQRSALYDRKDLDASMPKSA